MEKCINIHGLDPFVGFIHSDRPGKASLALDMMEEFRPCIADRIVMNIINNKQISINMFDRVDNSTVYCNKECREIIINQWEKKKATSITHNNESMTYGELIDYQIRLLVRRIKCIDTYKPFIWR